MPVGLNGISEKYNVNLSSLNSYLHTNGTLTVKEKSFLGVEPNNKLTLKILKEIMSLGAVGIANAGGLKRISEKYNVHLSTLNNYLDKNDTLTVSGKIFLDVEPNKVTPKILKEIMSLGTAGIANTNGLKVLNEKYNVSLSTLKNYLYKNGPLSFKGGGLGNPPAYS
ncbi:MAG: hypothetical protein ACL7BU_16250 [Candidatus Phlomobacter fragariae]